MELSATSTSEKAIMSLQIGSAHVLSTRLDVVICVGALLKPETPLDASFSDVIIQKSSA